MITKEARAEWREQNREKIRAYDRARYAVRPEKIKNRAAAWYKAHPDRVREIRRRWREKNRENINARSKAYRAAGAGDSRRWRALKVTPGVFAEKFESQGKQCAVCASTESVKWNLDHDHITGLVRGVLCNRCNLGLGLFRDSPVVLQAATRYLECYRQLQELL